MDSQIINNLPTTTIEMISSIQDLIKMYHDDEEMKDGEHDDTTCGHDSTNRSGITKENENLTETVRNMSRTNIILAEENRELKSLLTSSARPQPPTPGIGLEGSIHAPTPHATITKSANPVPIIPPRKDRTPTKNTIPPRSQPTTPTQRHHKSRLVIHFTPPIESKALRPHGCIIHEINEALKKISPQIPESVRVKGMIISGARPYRASDRQFWRFRRRRFRPSGRRYGPVKPYR